MRRIGEHESLFLRLFLRDRALAEQKLRTVGLARDDRIDDGVVLSMRIEQEFVRGPLAGFRRATLAGPANGTMLQRAASSVSSGIRGRRRCARPSLRARRREVGFAHALTGSELAAKNH